MWSPKDSSFSQLSNTTLSSEIAFFTSLLPLLPVEAHGLMEELSESRSVIFDLTWMHTIHWKNEILELELVPYLQFLNRHSLQYGKTIVWAAQGNIVVTFYSQQKLIVSNCRQMSYIILHYRDRIIAQAQSGHTNAHSKLVLPQVGCAKLQLKQCIANYAHKDVPKFQKLIFQQICKSMHSHSCNHLLISSKVSFQRTSTTLVMYKSMYTF